MKRLAKFGRCRRRGLSMAEMIIALSITVVAMVGIAQLMSLVTRQYRAMDCHAMAMREAANVMEDLMSRPWDETATSEQVTIDLSKACLQTNPDAKLGITIDTETEDVRRFVVQIDWTRNGGKSEPVRLVAWRHHVAETTP